MIKWLKNLLLKDINQMIHRELIQLYKNQEALHKRLDIIEKKVVITINEINSCVNKILIDLNS